MKILQISNYIYPTIGGIGRVSEDTARFLKKVDMEQKIICYNDVSANAGSQHKRIKNVVDDFEGTEVIRCGCIAKLFSQSLSPFFPFRLKRIMSDFCPDVVIFHYPNPFAAFFLLRLKQPFKLVLWWHSDIVKNRVLIRLFDSQNRKLIRRADAIIGATPKHISDSAYAGMFAPEKIRTIPYAVGEYRFAENSVNGDSVQTIRSQFANKIICLFIGRHVAYKGLRYLLEASKMLDDRFAFLIAGSGKLTQKLKAQSADDKKVFFIGELTEKEKTAYLKACDIFCFPSITKNENFGLALAEAMYFGKPAVTFTIEGSGVNYVSVNGLTGIECPNRDSKAFAEALDRLASDDELRERLGNAARKHMLKNFSDKLFQENLLKLVRELDDTKER